MNGYLAVGLTALVGAALIEAALVPGLVIGGAALIAPAVLPRLNRARRRAQRSARSNDAEPAAETRFGFLAPIRAAHKIEITRSLLKTITFRVVVTAFDFAGGWIILGDPLLAAGLSGASLVVGPFFYFLHETLWNYYGPENGAVALRLPVLRRERPDGQAEREARDGEPQQPEFTRVSRALAKTVTFRAAATIPDFAVNFLVIGDPAVAAALSVYGLVMGPIVYFAHEKVWEAFARRGEPLALPASAAGA